MERIRLAAAEQPAAAPPVDVYVALASPGARAAAFAVASEARRARLGTQLELAGRSLKGQLKQADRLGARYVAIVAEDGGAQLKAMDTGEQEELRREEVVPAILRERGMR